MAYREKTAWLTLVAMLIAYGIYFALIGVASRLGEPGLVEMLWWFGGITMVQLIVVILGSVLIAMQVGGEARIPADERDRAIARRGANTAYFVLMIGVILVGVVMPLENLPAWRIVNAALLALVVAETVRYTIIVVSYRRGWHG
ncbi:hypothetical protein IAG41_14605 [Sphingomonas sp. JC676]|uniref:hypothetical protein n=1 Tax=Sphingomonas sp. JC676 TaxID=2768065 RepID=UPI001657C929|nr:hypothetical protein [Sphingomonas sp. JC676]MBC9033625.1 hypothetical protein [Sphingomonas sp. JC676]